MLPLERRVFGLPQQKTGNPAETTVRREADVQADFSIRGHHLATYSELIRGQYSYTDECYIRPLPILLATQIAMSRKAEVARIEYRQRHGKHTERDRQNLRYDIDTIKETESDLALYIQRTKIHFERFNALPDDAIVEITARKDTQCSTCPLVGEHCQTSADTFGKEGGTRIARDIEGITLFRQEAARLGVGDQIGTFTDMTDYIDRENIEYTALRMTAGVLRHVLQESGLLNEVSSYVEE